MLATKEIYLIHVHHYINMVSLVRGGLSLVNLSTYGVIVFFFNLKVKKKKEKAVNHKIDNNNFQSCKINLKAMIISV